MSFFFRNLAGAKPKYMKRLTIFAAAALLLSACQGEAPDLKLNELGYFER